MRLVGNVIPLGAHGHIFCSEFSLYRCNRSLRPTSEEVKDMKEDFEGKEEKRAKGISDTRPGAFVYQAPWSVRS